MAHRHGPWGTERGQRCSPCRRATGRVVDDRAPVCALRHARLASSVGGAIPTSAGPSGDAARSRKPRATRTRRPWSRQAASRRNPGARPDRTTHVSRETERAELRHLRAPDCSGPRRTPAPPQRRPIASVPHRRPINDVRSTTSDHRRPINDALSTTPCSAPPRRETPWGARRQRPCVSTSRATSITRRTSNRTTPASVRSDVVGRHRRSAPIRPTSRVARGGPARWRRVGSAWG